jgi:NADP-dependent 3-hydroxy acid dehydrogenase YdfG
MKTKRKPINEQVFVITGASGLTGAATVRIAASRGARLVLADAEETSLQLLAEEVGRNGGEAMYVVSNVSREEDCIRIAQSALRTYGSFDTWINLTDKYCSERCVDVKASEMQQIFDANFWGVVHGSRVAADHFGRRGIPGVIITMGLIPHHSTDAANSLYSVSKNAMEEWLAAFRIEITKMDISVCMVHPGRRPDSPRLKQRINLSRKKYRRNYTYSPLAVAEAVVDCAAHPKTNLYPSGQSRLLSVLDGISPRLSTKIGEVVTQKKTTNEKSDNQTETKQELSRVHLSTLYKEVLKRPVLSSIVLAGLGAGVWLLTKRKGNTTS